MQDVKTAIAPKAGKRLPGSPEPAHYWSGFNGIQLAGDAWGDPAAPLVLLLHGGGQTRHAWGATGALFAAAGYFAVALDARGHGDSAWSAGGDYSLDAMVADLVCVNAALGGRKPILIGASMGGATCLAAVGGGHLEASALILVDIVPHAEPEGVARIHQFMRQQPDGYASLEEVAESIRQYRPHSKPRRNLQGLSKNVRLGEDGRYRWHWDPKFLAGWDHMKQRYERLSACARRLAVPTLLVRGASSDVVSETGAREFLELCPHAETINVTQAGHMVAGDRNDLFGRAAKDFLERTVPAVSNRAPN